MCLKDLICSPAARQAATCRTLLRDREWALACRSSLPNRQTRVHRWSHQGAHEWLSSNRKVLPCRARRPDHERTRFHHTTRRGRTGACDSILPIATHHSARAAGLRDRDSTLALRSTRPGTPGKRGTVGKGTTARECSPSQDRRGSQGFESCTQTVSSPLLCLACFTSTPSTCPALLTAS